MPREVSSAFRKLPDAPQQEQTNLILREEASTPLDWIRSRFAPFASKKPWANHRPPTTDHQPPTTNHRSPTTNPQPPTTNHQPPTTSHQPPATSGSHLATDQHEAELLLHELTHANAGQLRGQEARVKQRVPNRAQKAWLSVVGKGERLRVNAARAVDHELHHQRPLHTSTLQLIRIPRMRIVSHGPDGLLHSVLGVRAIWAGVRQRVHRRSIHERIGIRISEILGIADPRCEI